ncbi:MAG: aromatic ring-hydroxylating dioxygenase subunit alpha, partial [Betaproteobacteria bacterium]
AAVQESMGPIEDRSRENLVSSDNGIIMTRKRLLDAARGNAEGRDPPGLDAEAQCVRAVSMVTPRDVPFTRALAEHEGATKREEVA